MNLAFELFNMLEAKNPLCSLVAALAPGEEVLLVRNGVPAAKIVASGQAPIKPPGAWKGLVARSADWNSAETQAQVEGLLLGDGDAT